jgi:hypothetical protein
VPVLIPQSLLVIYFVVATSTKRTQAERPALHIKHRPLPSRRIWDKLWEKSMENNFFS